MFLIELGRLFQALDAAEGRMPCGWYNQRQVVGGEQAATGTHFGDPVEALGKVCRS